MKPNSNEVIIKDFEYLLLLLDPKFVEIDRLVLFTGNILEEDYERYWKDKALVNKQKTERTINHVHLDDITDRAEDQYELGKALKDIWIRKLLDIYPDKHFEVTLEPSQFGWQLDMFSK